MLALVPDPSRVDGERRFGLILAACIVQRQSTRHWVAFRCRSQAATSRFRVAGSSIRRSKHCLARTLRGYPETQETTFNGAVATFLYWN